MTTDERKEVLKKACKEMCTALNTFGCEETLKLLVEFSNDLIVKELLTRYPSIVSSGDFMFGKPILEVDTEEFGTLEGASSWIWKAKKEDENNRE